MKPSTKPCITPQALRSRLPIYATALREAHEELNVDPASLALWTDLSTVYIPATNYQIHPFTANSDRRPDFQPIIWGATALVLSQLVARIEAGPQLQPQ
jgi:8-oxo-dGTP pyrophosphatase MutT (NUDIX family)